MITCKFFFFVFYYYRDLALYRFFKNLFNSFQPSITFHIENSHLIFSENQMTGFYMKCNLVFPSYRNYFSKFSAMQKRETIAK